MEWRPVANAKIKKGSTRKTPEKRQNENFEELKLKLFSHNPDDNIFNKSTHVPGSKTVTCSLLSDKQTDIQMMATSPLTNVPSYQRPFRPTSL